MAIHRPLCFAIRDDPLHKIERPYSHNYFPPEGTPRTNVTQEYIDGVEIRDIRHSELSWSRNGIAVTRLETSLPYEDFNDNARVETVFLSEARDCLREFLGTQDVHLVEYVIRRRSDIFPAVKGLANAFTQPVQGAHVVDYTAFDVESRIRIAFEDQAEQRLASDYLMVNMWKPLRGPVRDWPLAYCDPLTIDPTKDTITVDSVNAESVGEALNIHFNPQQHWYYLSEQEAHEATIFKGYDTRQPSSCGVAHCAFKLGDDGQAQRPRESIEIRAIAFFPREESP